MHINNVKVFLKLHEIVIVINKKEAVSKLDIASFLSILFVPYYGSIFKFQIL